MKRSFEIPDENLSAFKTAIEKLARRAIKLGSQPPWLDIDPQPIDEVVNHGSLNNPFDRSVYRTWNVTVNGESPKFAGWTFIGTLQHLREDDGNIATVLRIITDAIEIPVQYRTAAPDCAHCNHHRYRRTTYLLCHDSGQIKQVGSSCIKDFLGHTSPEKLAEQAELLAQVMDTAEGWDDQAGGGMRTSHLPHVLDFLACAAALIRTFGFMSRRNSDSECGKPATATMAMAMVSDRNDKLHKQVKIESGDYERGRLAIEWAQELEPGKSDYLHNLRVISRCTALADRTEGIAASMIPAYDRARSEEEVKKLTADSNYVGELGKRQVFGPIRVLQAKEIDSNFGRSILFLFADESGNVMKTFSSASEKLGNIGDTLWIKGTPKKHDEWLGSKQTLLSRVAVHSAGSLSPEVKTSRRKKSN